MSGCVTSYPKARWLKTNTYCLGASVVQASGHGLAGYLRPKVSDRATVKVLTGAWLGKGPLRAHLLLAGFSYYGLLDWELRYLMAVGQRHHFLAKWTSLLGSLQHGCWLSSGKQRKRRQAKWKPHVLFVCLFFCILVLQIISHLFVIFYYLEASH